MHVCTKMSICTGYVRTLKWTLHIVKDQMVKSNRLALSQHSAINYSSFYSDRATILFLWPCGFLSDPLLNPVQRTPSLCPQRAYHVVNGSDTPCSHHGWSIVFSSELIHAKNCHASHTPHSKPSRFALLPVGNASNSLMMLVGFHRLLPDLSLPSSILL
jgi:hypothetical protein